MQASVAPNTEQPMKEFLDEAQFQMQASVAPNTEQLRLIIDDETQKSFDALKRHDKHPYRVWLNAEGKKIKPVPGPEPNQGIRAVLVDAATGKTRTGLRVKYQVTHLYVSTEGPTKNASPDTIKGITPVQYLEIDPDTGMSKEPIKVRVEELSSTLIGREGESGWGSQIKVAADRKWCETNCIGIHIEPLVTPPFTVLTKINNTKKKKANDDGGAGQKHSSSKRQRTEADSDHVLRDFRLIDTNNDGKISVDEFTDFMNQNQHDMYAIVPQYTVDQIKTTFAKVDSNSDGFIDLNEFNQIVQQALQAREPGTLTAILMSHLSAPSQSKTISDPAAGLTRSHSEQMFCELSAPSNGATGSPPLREGSQVTIIKNGKQQGKHAVVIDPNWNSLVKVRMKLTNDTKSYKRAELKLFESAASATSMTPLAATSIPEAAISSSTDGSDMESCDESLGEIGSYSAADSADPDGAALVRISEELTPTAIKGEDGPFGESMDEFDGAMKEILTDFTDSNREIAW